MDGTSKITDLIDFPLENLDLSEYVKGYHSDSYKYDLYGVCNHVGSYLEDIILHLLKILKIYGIISMIIK